MVKPRTRVAGIVAAVLMVVGSPILSVVASVQIAERNAQRQIDQVAVAKEAASVEAKRITCSFFGSSMDVYRENPPTTDAGRAQYANYADLYRISGCQPPRVK